MKAPGSPKITTLLSLKISVVLIVGNGVCGIVMFNKFIRFGISYIKQPDKPNWTYLLSGEAALFNEDANAGWRDFELHEEEENALVIKILQLAGVNLKDYNLVQIAGQESAKNFNQENQ